LGFTEGVPGEPGPPLRYVHPDRVRPPVWPDLDELAARLDSCGPTVAPRLSPLETKTL